MNYYVIKNLDTNEYLKCKSNGFIWLMDIGHASIFNKSIHAVIAAGKLMEYESEHEIKSGDYKIVKIEIKEIE